MSERTPDAAGDIDWGAAAELLRTVLSGPVRRDIVDRALRGGDMAAALDRLRSWMSAHRFRTGSGPLELADVVRVLDGAARADGFHVLREWHQSAHEFSRNDVPVLMLDFCRRHTFGGPVREALAVLLDYYFLYVLALLVMRVWDEGDPNANLDSVTDLVALLQGPAGSGQRFVDGAATLLYVATSNFQPDESAYERLLDKVWTLDEDHRAALAVVGGPVVATHLRWALWAIYERDLVRTRNDNAVDYSWLLFSALTLARSYGRLHRSGIAGNERSVVVGALLNTLSADPWAFTGEPPDILTDYAAEHAELRELLVRHRDHLLDELAAHRPTQGAYSPVSLQFNFPHNVLVASVVLSVTGGDTVPNLPLDTMLTSRSSNDPDTGETERLARSVTGFAAAHPERRGERRVFIVAYNPSVGARSFARTMSVLGKEI